MPLVATHSSRIPTATCCISTSTSRANPKPCSLPSDKRTRLRCCRSLLDRSVDQCAQVRKLRQLLGFDLVAGPGQVDGDHLLEHRRPRGQDEDAIAHVHRLIYVM